MSIARRRDARLVATAMFPVLALLMGCASARPLTSTPAVAEATEATSLLGTPLLPPPPPAAFRERQEALLAEAQARLAADPDDLDAWIWVGRRLAYLGRYRAAIAQYSRAMERFPTAAEPYRHRGHRYLTVREIGRAGADLARAVELMASRPDAVEPDGLPNERNLPTSTLRSNVWYHLGLARYLAGDMSGAADAFTAAREAVANADNVVAASYWLYLANAAAGNSEAARAALAPITSELDVIENREYHRLLLVFRGDDDAELLLAQAEAGGGQQLATVGYGIAAWRLSRGEREAAAHLLGQVVESTPWPAFGHLAAEALLARDTELRRLAGR